MNLVPTLSANKKINNVHVYQMINVNHSTYMNTKMMITQQFEVPSKKIDIKLDIV